MLCDRNTVNFAGSQVGFINFVIKPYFTILSDILPKLKYTVNNASENVAKYE